MGHFTLDLEPATLRKTATSLEEIADHMRTSGKKVRDTPGEIGDDWTGAAAETVKPEMTKLGEQMSSAGSNYEKKLDAAAKALRTLATAYDTAVEETGTLNTKWNTAQDLEDEAEKKKEEKRLQGLFDDVKTEAEKATRTCGTTLGSNSPVEVTHPDGPSGDPQIDRSALFTHLSLAGQGKAWSTYQDAKKKIEHGDLPPFDEMTEEERTRFLEENPDLLPSMMEIDNPDAETANDIIALATPRVTGEDGKKDGKTAVDATDGKASAADFLDAFTDAGEVSDAMALLGPWAKRNGVDLTGNQHTVNALDYQESFLNEIGPHHEDVSNYMAAHSHTWETGETAENIRGMEYDVTETSGEFTPTWQKRLNQIYGDTILSVSNEEFGGGWDRLPEDIRNAITDTQGFGDRTHSDFDGIARAIAHSSGGIPPGDQLALELADNVGNDLYMHMGDTAPGPRSDYELVGVGNEENLGALLEVIARNREATTAILTGDEGAVTDAGSGPYGQFDGELPDSFNHQEFVKNVYTYHWEDDGQAASSLAEWMDDAFTAGEGSPDYANAQKAYDGLTTSLTNTEDGNYRDLLDTQDTDKSVGEVNPELMRSLGRATEHPHILEGMATESDEGETSADLRLLMLLAGDQETGERLAGAVTAYNADVMGGDMNSRGKSEHVGNLSGLLDSALYNEAYERTGNAQDAEDERAEAIKTGISMLTGLVPDPSGATGAGGSLLSHFIKPDNVEPVDPRIDADWSEEGNHVTLGAYDALAAQLNATGAISDEELRRVQEFDASTQGEHIGEYERLFEQHDLSVPDNIGPEYTARLNNLVASGGKEELEDLIDHGTVPGPG